MDLLAWHDDLIRATHSGFTMWTFGERGFAMGPFFVGAALIVAAALVY